MGTVFADIFSRRAKKDSIVYQIYEEQKRESSINRLDSIFVLPSVGDCPVPVDGVAVLGGEVELVVGRVGRLEVEPPDNRVG